MRICILSAYENSMRNGSGASVRIINLAKGLVKNGNEVTVILPNYHSSTELVGNISVHKLSGFLPESLFTVMGKIGKIEKPSALYFFDFFFAFRASSLVQNADIIQIEQPALSLLLAPLLKRSLRKPIAIDCHDVFQALRVKHTSLVRRILETFLEKIAFRNADLLLTVSEKERELLVSFGYSKQKIIVVPNGVATEEFSRTSDLQETRRKYGLGDERIVVFVGNLAYVPNWEAVNLVSSVIAPKVREEVKDVKFLVVGKNIGNMALPGVTFTGFVDNLADLLAASDVGIAPLLQGSGTRLKILEYFSSGLPVVSTSVGAEGLPTKNGENIFIADDPEDFSKQIIQLLKHPELSVTLGKAGKALAANYDWGLITEKLNSEFHTFLWKQQSSSGYAKSAPSPLNCMGT